jgi:hypothetical protein
MRIRGDWGVAGGPDYAALHLWTANEEVVFQIILSGPANITFRNPADDPRKK